MFRLILFIALLLTSISAQADLPVKGVDPLKLQATFSGPEILDGMSFANLFCRDDFFACGPISEFLLLNQTGVTDSGQTATLSLSRWFYEPLTWPVGFHIWSEVIYIEIWMGPPPYTDYSGASMVTHGLNFWTFVDQVLESAAANQKGSFSLSGQGWYGVHMNDWAGLAQTAAPVDIIFTATVNKVGGATEGEIELNFTLEPQ